MARLSTDPSIPNMAGHQFGKWCTFAVFARVVPNLANGKRFEYVRDLEKIANRVEDAVSEITDTEGTLVMVPGPVMFTHQFAQYPTKLTFTGFFRSSKPVLSPVTTRSIDYDNGVVVGPGGTGGNLRGDCAPTVDNDDDVRTLKAVLEGISPDLNDIIRIELNNVLYGKNGRSFPT